jgi:ZIP family zinc transporter
MREALLFGLLGSSALVLGGVLGAYWQAPNRISGVLLAFASGTLISALAFELFPEAVHLGGPVAGGPRADSRGADLRHHQHRARLLGGPERR